MDTEAILAAMVADSVERIRKADQDAHEAQASFAAGEFQAYYDKKRMEIEAAIEAEFQAIMGAGDDTTD